MSHNDRYIAESRAHSLSLKLLLHFAVGYVDHALRELHQRFDVVINRVCRHYAFGEQSFAAVLWSLVRPGDFDYVDTTNSNKWRRELSASARFRTWLNESICSKIGHLMPPREHLACEFLRLPVERLVVDYRVTTNDRGLFRRCPESG